MTCSNCPRTDARRLIKGLCDRCYEYQRRTGESRPPVPAHLPTGPKRDAPLTCQDCGGPKGRGSMEYRLLCRRCYHYRYHHGYALPLEVSA